MDPTPTSNATTLCKSLGSSVSVQLLPSTQLVRSKDSLRHCHLSLTEKLDCGPGPGKQVPPSSPWFPCIHLRSTIAQMWEQTHPTNSRKEYHYHRSLVFSNHWLWKQGRPRSELFVCGPVSPGCQELGFQEQFQEA